jgi:PEP-CTERM motif
VGSGQVTLWLGSQVSDNTASFSADFPDTAGTDFSAFYATNTNSEQWFLNYTASVAQTMTVTLNPGSSGNVGFFAAAVSQVPEPSTTALFVLAGMIGLFRSRILRVGHKSS